MNIFKTLNQKGQHNWIKILCPGIGLATGIVLIGKAFTAETAPADYVG